MELGRIVPKKTFRIFKILDYNIVEFSFKKKFL